ncbi:hypothetical protein CFOL_v3_19017 [Cephalotus follicularis]|uniref:Uncharacterized protein n=1 Tax=Cephalotus follicularis TaxID=3775 RepID=A0A1Q3C628_CEPFO|nr:hypothetical protein CFOL_v3_19017 [Cephalotus follicularis]
MHKATKVGLSYNNSCIIMSSAKARFGSSKGGAGVLERPTFDQSQFDPTTQVLEGGDIGQLRHKIRTERGDSYRVLLVDDVRHSEKLGNFIHYSK